MTAEEEPERDVPGGPEDRILCSHCRGSRFKPWLGIVRSHIPHDKTKKKKKNPENNRQIYKQKTSLRRKEGSERCNTGGCEDGRGARNQGLWEPLEARKGKEFPLEPPTLPTP